MQQFVDDMGNDKVIEVAQRMLEGWSTKDRLALIMEFLGETMPIAPSVDRLVAGFTNGFLVCLELAVAHPELIKPYRDIILDLAAEREWIPSKDENPIMKWVDMFPRYVPIEREEVNT